EFTSDATLLTKKERLTPGSQEAVEQAELELAMAELQREASMSASAQSRYELIKYRYPDSAQAKKAMQGLEELKKHRVTLADGSEYWDNDHPPRPVPPPAYAPSAPLPSQEIIELRQQVKALQQRLAALEGKGKPAREVQQTARVARIMVVGEPQD